jgi:hypothetical protein
VGVTLRLNNLISPQLTLLAKEFEKLDGLTIALRESLGKIEVNSKGLRSIASAGNSANRALEKATLSAASFERRLAAINSTAGGSAAIPLLGARRGAGAGGPSLPGGGGGGRGGANHFGRGGLHGGNIHFGSGGFGVGSVGMAAGDALIPLAVSAGIIYAGKSLFEAAKDLDTERQRFKLFGLTQAQNQDAFNFVDRLNIGGTTRAENMRAFTEAQGVFRESGEDGATALRGAKLATPILAKLNFLASTLDEESAAKMKTANMAMLRYVESSGGVNSPEEFRRLANFGFKLNTSSGGTVNWEQLRQFRARAGAAGYQITDEGLARLEPIIGENKGGAVGFGVSTAFNRLNGAIRLPNQVVHELLDSGIWDKSKVILNSSGGVKTFLGNPLGADKSQQLLEDPVLFYEKFIRPIYTKMKFDAAEVARQNVMIFGTTGARSMNAVEKQLPAIEQSIEALRKAKGIDDAVNAARQSLTGQEEEFTAAWTDFKTSAGTTFLPFFTGLLHGGTKVLRALNGTDNPEGKHWVPALGRGPGARFGIGGHWEDDAPATPFVATAKPAAPKPVQVNMMLDGRKVGQLLSPYLADGLGKPLGGGNFDGTLTMAPVVLNQAH